eukprot:gene2419-8738_t
MKGHNIALIVALAVSLAQQVSSDASNPAPGIVTWCNYTEKCPRHPTRPQKPRPPNATVDRWATDAAQCVVPGPEPMPTLDYTARPQILTPNFPTTYNDRYVCNQKVIRKDLVDGMGTVYGDVRIFKDYDDNLVITFSLDALKNYQPFGQKMIRKDLVDGMGTVYGDVCIFKDYDDNLVITFSLDALKNYQPFGQPFRPVTDQERFVSNLNLLFSSYLGVQVKPAYGMPEGGSGKLYYAKGSPNEFFLQAEAVVYNVEDVLTLLNAVTTGPTKIQVLGVSFQLNCTDNIKMEIVDCGNISPLIYSGVDRSVG